MVSSGSDQIAEKASSETSSDRNSGGGIKRRLSRKGSQSEVWRVKPRADDRQDLDLSATAINLVVMLPPIQAVGFPNVV